MSLSVLNVLNQVPPRVHVPAGSQQDIGYDPVNATSVGRLIALQVTKQWAGN